MPCNLQEQDEATTTALVNHAVHGVNAMAPFWQRWWNGSECNTPNLQHDSFRNRHHNALSRTIQGTAPSPASEKTITLLWMILLNIRISLKEKKNELARATVEKRRKVYGQLSMKCSSGVDSTHVSDGANLNGNVCYLYWCCIINICFLPAVQREIVVMHPTTVTKRNLPKFTIAACNSWVTCSSIPNRLLRLINLVLLHTLYQHHTVLISICRCEARIPACKKWHMSTNSRFASQTQVILNLSGVVGFDCKPFQSAQTSASKCSESWNKRMWYPRQSPHPPCLQFSPDQSSDILPHHTSCKPA